MSDPQRFIEDALGRVTVPDDLRARLSPESLFADAELDRLLARVPVPPELNDAIRRGVRSQPTRFQDGALDLSLFATDRGNGSGKPPRPDLVLRSRSRLPSVARDIVSVITALGLVIVLAVAGIEVSRQLEGTPRESRVATRLDFNELVDTRDVDWPLRVDVPDGTWNTPEQHAPPQPPPLSVAATGDHDDKLGAMSELAGGGGAPHVPGRPPSPAVVRGAAVSADLPSGMRGPASMTTVVVPGVARRSVPRVRGYDLAFEMTTGEQPFIDPASDPTLAMDRPPLTLGTDGFERGTAAHDRGPGPIRAEEILAAVSPPPSEPPKSLGVGLHLHEVRGLRTLGDRRTILLEVAATAGPVVPPSQPVNATLILDQAAAGDPAVWQRTCRAMADLADQLTADDRVNVVLCGPRPRLVLQAAGPQALLTLATDLEWQPASATSDMDAGLGLAPPADRIVVVAHANSLDGPGDNLGKALAAWHTALSAVGGDTLACQPAGGTRFVILDPAAPASAEPGEPTFGRTASDTVSIRRAIIRQVTGHDTLVARDCSLEVRFDPRQVARYRLIGHRQSAVESLADSQPRGTELHAGETVRVVYELVPRSLSARPGLASAVLTWTGPRGDRQRLDGGPNRSADDLGEGLPSPHGCELLLAASLGELASGSAHVSRRPALAATVDQLIEAWRSRGDVTAVGDALARIHDRGIRVPRKAW